MDPLNEKFLRTPDERFNNLKDFDFQAHYEFIDEIRIHYLDENQNSNKVIVILHGEPAWCYSFRNIIPKLVASGYRVIAPDILGFGKSDKPKSKNELSYSKLVEWFEILLFNRLKLNNINLVLHDWGGIIGLRMVANHQGKFSSVIAMNTAFPRFEGINPVFILWRTFCQFLLKKPISELIPLGLYNKSALSEEELKAYDAPFPTIAYKIAPKTLPKLVPIFPWQKETWVNRKIWKDLKKFDKPFLTIFSNKDHFTKKAEVKLINQIEGARNVKHIKLEDVGHFPQEEKPEELSHHILNFLDSI